MRNGNGRIEPHKDDLVSSSPLNTTEQIMKYSPFAKLLQENKPSKIFMLMYHCRKQEKN